MKNKSQHTPETMTFDGVGINGNDVYRSRLATLTEEGTRLNIGPLLAAAPEMLEALKAILALRGSDAAIDLAIIQDLASAAISKAEGGK